MKIRNLILATLCIISSAAHAETTPTPLKKGDRIVFLGDSITAGGVKPGGYVTLIKDEIAATHPDLGIEVIGAGVSGNKVPNLQARLEKDVLSKKPTIVFIYIGINDVWHWKKNKEGVMSGGTTTEAFESGLKDIIAQINAAGARVILCTATVIGEKHDGSNERDAMLEEYSAISRKVATDTKSQMVDLRKAFIDHLKANNPDNLPKGILTGDAVHLNPAGNRLVATEMGKAIGLKIKETAPN
ncbi:MAG: SGNH/GDSL hydrolase family protein [Verrucomicrobiota bacterium]